MADDTPTLYLVSDGSCRTCHQVVKAVLLQFSQIRVRLIRKTEVRQADEVRAVIKQAAKERALVFYTLVSEQTRRAMHEAALQHMVPVVDLLGPVLTSLYDLFRRAPRSKPGILYQSNRQHFDRIDAVEYTLNHDDGCSANELKNADVVLIGVSRACKSSTCFYLGYSGVRAANVPLVPDQEPPPELLELDPRRVIGLTINPHRLATLREERIRSWGMRLHDEYGEKRQIAQELRAANALMERHGWRRVDTSYKAIEEVAREVLSLLQDAGIEIGERQADQE